MSDKSETSYGALLKRSLVVIDELEAKLAAAQRSNSEPIAIIGMACRFPGSANTPKEFWDSLKVGTDAVSEVPKERWDADKYFDPDPDVEGKSYTRWGSFLDAFDFFDADLFGVSPREAVSLDPQHRILLESSWEALERSGVAPSSLMGSQTSVYVGISTHDYSLHVTDCLGINNGGPYAASGTAHSMASGRIAYAFGFHGPNVAVDTACSSSHVAVHLAMRSLRAREANLSLAAGVNLTLLPSGSILTSRARMMSPVGRCKTFDASADGYVRGEGCGVLVLKRLSDAQRDGDQIMAVIRGSALNQDGRSSGLTAPNGQAQEAVLRAALQDAGLAPDDISYIEAHGTGTSLGDPIEVKAIGAVFGGRSADNPLLLGSVKTNIGHAEAASGMAGIIKTVLALRNRAIPPHLHLREPNPLVDWDKLPIRIPVSLTPWESPNNEPLRAGVSSFGFSGTNGHVILEEAPPQTLQGYADAGENQLLVLSAQTPKALKEQAERFVRYLALDDAVPLAEIAYTLARGRSHLAERLAVVAHDRATARDRLAAFVAGDLTAVARGRAAGRVSPEIVFLFTGQGAQYAGMGVQLYATAPVFRMAMDECARLLEPHLSHPLMELIAGKGECAGLLDDTAYTQPALFAIEYSLAKLWLSWGVQPTAVMGHSVGEYVAACLAGVFSLEDGLKLIAARGRLMSGLPQDGAMVVVFADKATVRDAIAGREDDVSIAAVNGPTNIVISGRTEAVNAIVDQLASDGVEFQRLTVSHAFHSPLMDPILDEFEKIVGDVKFSAPQIELMSNLTGALAGEEVTRASYWREHLRGAVRFSDSIHALLRDGYRLFLEVGPAPTLVGMARRCEGADTASWAASLRPGRNELVGMLEGLGQLHVRGLRVDWESVFGGGKLARPIDLPTYAFQRQRFWQERTSSIDSAQLVPLRTPHPLLSGAIDSSIHIVQAELGIASHPWLADHRILDFTLFPAAGFLELASAGVREALGSHEGELQDLVIREPLVLPESGRATVQVVISPSAENRYAVRISSRDVDAPADGKSARWREHIAATFFPSAVRGGSEPLFSPVLLENVENFSAPLYYTRLAAQGAHYGPAFQGIKEISLAGFDVLGDLQIPEALFADASAQLLHPALLDAAFQLAGVLLPGARDEHVNATRYLPVGVERFCISKPAATSARCHVRVEPFEDGADTLRAHITLFDSAGSVIAEVTGLEYRRATRESLERALQRARSSKSEDDWLFEVDWRALPRTSGLSPQSDGRWIVLTDSTGVGVGLAERLRGEGAHVTLVHQRGAATADRELGVDPTDFAAMQDVLKASENSDSRPLVGVVSLWALDVERDTNEMSYVENAQRTLVTSTLHLLQTLADKPARLWLVTRGAQPASDCVPDLVQAPLLGLGNVIAVERPDLQCVRVDLDARSRPDETDLLFKTIWYADEEDRIALRDDLRLVARMSPGRLSPPSGETLALEITERGQLDRLMLRASERRAPGPGEVELRVHATGLNFRDVLNALGMYPGDPGPLGNECAGVITAVGEGVDHLRVGDQAVAMVDRSFATYVISPAAMTVRKPRQLSYAEAATLPVTFLTAVYALQHLARMRKGERVLIHAATGGVGMAAVQIARSLGAEIIGTAGSPAKRELARKLGVHHVADSRSLDFEQEVLRATNGEGVDVVLNSLAGDFIPASLRLLRDGGRFIEIGKTGIWNAEEVRRQFPRVEYHALYLGEVAATQPDLVRNMLEDVIEKCVSGDLQPLPLRVYPITRAEDAFRFMAQGQHTGKIVIVQPQPFEIVPDATYLITGGLGGLGLSCARWLAERGAEHIVLLSRRPASEEAEAQIANMTTLGAQVRVMNADVADMPQLAHVLDHMSATMPPLKGVLHAAGSVDDGMLSEQSWPRFASVMETKVRGTWNLHVLTRDAPLGFFVMFSSGAALLGSPGQSNYAAANSFLDSLAYVRRASGRPGLSINWGVWADVGMASRVDEQHQRRWADLGLRTIEPETGVHMLEQVLSGSGAPQVAALPIVRSKLPQRVPPFFTDLIVVNEAQTDIDSSEPADILPDLQELQGEGRISALVDFLGKQVMRVLALDSSQPIDPHRSLLDMGIDSLMTMELRNRLQGALKIPVAADELLTAPTLGQLATALSERLPSAVEPEGDEHASGSESDDESRSDDERQWVEL